MNVFEAVKQSVTTRQAAEHYGIRVGRSGMAACPFHNDKTPSMKVDSRFYCFGCGASGDVIDFVSRLDGIGAKEAAVRLAQDFSIPYDEKKTGEPYQKTIRRRQETPEQRFRQAEKECFRVLSDYYHLLRRRRKEYAPHQPDEEWNPYFVEALQHISHVEYLLDVLLSPDMEERAALIIEYGKEVKALERRMAELAAADTAGRREHRERHAAAPER